MCATITESLSFSTYVFLQDLATVIEEKYRTSCSFHFNGRLVDPVIVFDYVVYSVNCIIQSSTPSQTFPLPPLAASIS
jgi:hypothetical protein